MAFSHIPLRRTISAGVLTYLLQYAVTFVAVGSRTDALLQSVVVEPRYGDPATLPSFVEAAIPSWKAVGWVFHSAHNAKLVVPLPEHGVVQQLNLVAHASGWYQLLSLLPSIALLATGYAVARTSRTYGAQGEQFTGASITLGYLPCCIAGGLLFSVSRPAIAPALLDSILLAGLGYPVVFGWLGGLAARWYSKSEAEATSA